MAIIYNSEVTKNLIDSAKLATTREKTINQIADKIVPVLEVNPRLTRILNICRSAAGTNSNLTAWTTPSDASNFYLVGFTIHNTKNVTSDNASITVAAYIDGVQRTIYTLTGITLTASQSQAVVMLPFPVKIDRNTAITTTDTAHTAGTSVTSLNIWGYLEFP